MRRSALIAIAALALATPRATAGTGGAEYPPSAVTISGGTAYGSPLARRAGDAQPRAAFFRATARAQEKTPVHFAFRVNGRASYVQVSVDVSPAGQRKPAYRLDLGRQPTGRRVVWRWAAAPAAGNYIVRLHAVDPEGRRLARTAGRSRRARMIITAIPAPPPAPAPAPLPAVPGPVGGSFPIQGPHSFGGDDARFGAKRPGHVHQGQDVTAPQGTPLVSPVNGVVNWTSYQAKGAGYYVVIHGDDGRDYVFMHLQHGSLAVGRDQRVAAGQQIAAVGRTGEASGPHLHFEIWVGGWQQKGGQPIDPLPDLQAWERG